MSAGVRTWSYRLVDRGDDAGGNHRGVAVHEVHLDDGKVTLLGSRVTIDTYRDHFDAVSADSYRDAIIWQLERMLEIARTEPIIVAAEIGA